MTWAPRAIRSALFACVVANAATRALAQDPAPVPSEPPEAVRPQEIEKSPDPVPAEKVAIPPEPVKPPVLDFTASFDHASYEAALGRIAEAFPDLMRVRSLGKSRQGRELWLAILADIESGEARRLPAAIVLTDLSPVPSAGVAGPQAALFALESLLLRARADPAVREIFRRSAVYFLPAPDPDLAFPPDVEPRLVGATDGGSESISAPRTCRLEENFPARWQPFGPSTHAPGPYALSEPESRTLARFLLERENVSTLVVLSRADAKLHSEGRADAGTAEGKDGGMDGQAVEANASASAGSLRAFCREILDLAVLETRPWEGEARDTEVGKAPAGFDPAVALVLSALEALPRLECGASKIERLRPDLWLVDLPLRNAGLLPTLGGDSRRGGIPSVSMKLAGGRLVACALREGDLESYHPVPTGPGESATVSIGHLDGSGRLGVRLVVQAEEGAELQVAFTSARAGSATANVTLQ